MIQITLRAARVNNGLTLSEASKELGVHKDTLSKYERDSTNIPRSIFIKFEELYKIPIEYIFFGKESEFFRNNKETA